MPNIGNHTDYAPLAVDLHNFTERVLTGPKRARHRLVDHDYWFCRRSVSFRNIAAGAQRNAHRLYVTVSHDADKCVGKFPLLVNLALRRRTPTTVTAERERIRESGSFDSRDIFDSPEHVVEICI